jgi:hypothetical protein
MMKFSRRLFVKASGAVLGAATWRPLLGQTKAASPGQDTPRRKAQVNLNFFDTSLDFPFIDCARGATSIWMARGGAPAEDPFALMNSNGYPTRMCKGSANWTIFSSCYLLAGDPTWVLDWKGRADIFAASLGTPGIKFPYPGRPVTSNRREYVIEGVGDLPHGSAINFEIDNVYDGLYLRCSVLPEINGSPTQLGTNN